MPRLSLWSSDGRGSLRLLSSLLSVSLLSCTSTFSTKKVLFYLVLPQSLLALASLFDLKKRKNTPFGISMVVQWIRILPANAGDIGSILGPGKFHMP